MRNSTRQKKRSLLLGGAIAFGFLIITLLNSFTGGLLVTIQNNFSNAFGGHIYITGKEVNERNKEVSVMNNSAVLLESIDALRMDIASISKRSQTSGNLIFGTRQYRQKIEGVLLSEEKEFSTAFAVTAGTIDDLSKENAVMLSTETVQLLNLQIGETVLYKTTTTTGQQNVGEFILVAVFADQSGFGLTSGYTNLESLNKIIGLPAGSYQTVNIFLKDMASIDAKTELLYEKLKTKAIVESRETEKDETEDTHRMAANMMRMMGVQTIREVPPEESWEKTKFTIATLNDYTDQIMSLVEVLNVIGFIIFIVLMIITMVGIMNSFRMVMIERTQEIGAMRAMGVQKNNIRNIFIFEALIIALLGAAAGLFFSVTISGILGLVNFGTDSFISFFLDKGYLSLVIPVGEIFRNIITVSFLSLAAVLLPARAAAKLKPVVALQTNY